MIRHKDRFFVEFLKDYCAKHSIKLTSIPGSWIFILESPSRQHIVMGYDLGLNSSVAAKICNEKTATFNILNDCGVPAIPHYLFLPPAKRRYAESFGEGNWPDMIELHISFGGLTVVKQDNGTGGQNVFLAKSLEELEASSLRIFGENNNVALSPFSPLDREVRFIIHHSNILLCHEYIRPHVVGDGENSVQQLLHDNKNLPWFLTDSGVDLHLIPPEGSIYRLGFQRKVPGAQIHPVDVRTVPDARDIALNAFSSLGLTFGSIDLVFTDQKWKILEAHSGVMLEGPYRSGRIPKHKLFAAYSTAMDSTGLISD